MRCAGLLLLLRGPTDNLRPGILAGQDSDGQDGSPAQEAETRGRRRVLAYARKFLEEIRRETSDSRGRRCVLVYEQEYLKAFKLDAFEQSPIDKSTPRSFYACTKTTSTSLNSQTLAT